LEGDFRRFHSEDGFWGIIGVKDGKPFKVKADSLKIS
jgi:hypothetical protein